MLVNDFTKGRLALETQAGANIEAYKELTSDENHDAVIGSRLGVKGGDLVLDLGEGEALFVPCQYIFVCTAVRAKRTTSFSMMFLSPRTEADSKVSMEWGRCFS